MGEIKPTISAGYDQNFVKLNCKHIVPAQEFRPIASFDSGHTPGHHQQVQVYVLHSQVHVTWSKASILQTDLTWTNILVDFGHTRWCQVECSLYTPEGISQLHKQNPGNFK